ncbi:MAG: cupin domain-containing protein [Candidatus Eisenbacteria bacterium]
MTQHRNSSDHPNDAMQEMAALHALSALSPEEEKTFTSHLVDCPACQELVASLQDVSASLEMLASPPVTPPPQIKERLLAQIAVENERARKTQVWRNWQADASHTRRGLITVRAGEGTWEETDAPGVSVKPLWIDSERDYVTMLVRMQAGSSYPGHLHAGVEECLVLEGDLQVAGQELHAGDYQRANEGSEHGIQATRDGCLLLIVSSQHDSLR